jgi:tetratricopeptide (TPR) repeat protein
MKFKQFKTSFCLSIVLMLPAFCLAVELKGDAYYAKGQFKQAITSYQAVINEGYQSANLFYNLGNAYFKSGEIPSAILYYEKARLLSPGDEDINSNIRFANSKTVDKIEEVPQFFLEGWWTNLILAVSADTLGFIAVILTLIASALLILYFFSTQVAVKKASFFTSLAIYVAVLLAITMAQGQVSYLGNNKQAIIFSSVVNVKSSPAGEAPTAFILHEGTKVNIEEANSEWIRIKLANGNQGWLKSVEIKRI